MSSVIAESPLLNATIRSVDIDDSVAIAAIYNHYIATSVITFEEQPVSVDTMAQRIADVQSYNLPWLVFVRNGALQGYAYATRWKPRSAYRHSVEITIYTAPGVTGGGIGTALYSELFACMKACGVHAAVGGIALPNAASVALHEKFGMKKIGEFQEIGFKQGQWLNVGYWQIIFDNKAAL